MTGTTYQSSRLPQREVFPQRGTVPHREGKSRRSCDSVAIVSQHQALGVKGQSGPDIVDEGIQDCEMVRMMGVEERERSQRWNERAVLETRRLKGEIESLRTRLSDERRARRELARSHTELRTLTNGLVQTVGDLRDDLARLMCWVSNSLPRARPLVDSARMVAEPIHMLIEHKG